MFPLFLYKKNFQQMHFAITLYGSDGTLSTPPSVVDYGGVELGVKGERREVLAEINRVQDPRPAAECRRMFIVASTTYSLLSPLSLFPLSEYTIISVQQH